MLRATYESQKCISKLKMGEKEIFDAVVALQPLHCRRSCDTRVMAISHPLLPGSKQRARINTYGQMTCNT